MTIRYHDDDGSGFGEIGDPPHVGGDHAALCRGCPPCDRAEAAWLAHQALRRLRPCIVQRERDELVAGFLVLEVDRVTRDACLTRYPSACPGDYDPLCCRFPKSCSVPPAVTP